MKEDMHSYQNMDNTLWEMIIFMTIFFMFLHAKENGKICLGTVSKVSCCATESEYTKKARTCSEMCGKSEGPFMYHCMRDPLKTSLYEFCAQPKILFDFCPEYDPVGQLIERDESTRCNFTSPHIYNSSNIFLCDPDNCLKLNGTRPTVNTTETCGPTVETVLERDNHLALANMLPPIVAVYVIVGIVVTGALIYKHTQKKKSKRQSVQRALNSSNEVLLWKKASVKSVKGTTRIENIKNEPTNVNIQNLAALV